MPIDTMIRYTMHDRSSMHESDSNSFLVAYRDGSKTGNISHRYYHYIVDYSSLITFSLRIILTEKPILPISLLL